MNKRDLALTLVFIALSLVLPVAILAAILRYGVNVPYQDEWTQMVPLIVAAHKGTLTLHDLWIPHNEHRMFFPNVALLALARLSGWNMVHEMIAGLCVVVATQAIFFVLVSRSIGARFMGPVFLTISLLLFSLAQWENWFWGISSAWFFVNFLVVAVVALLWLHPRSRLSYALAMALAFIASYSLSSGLLAWIAGLSVLLLQSERAFGRKAVVWLIAFAAATGVYLYGFRLDPNHHNFGPVLHAPVAFVLYALAYLGGPLGSWHGTALAEALGALLLVLTAMAFARYLRDRSRAPAMASRVTPWLGLASFALSSSVLTAIGRSSQGAAQGTSSRYTTIAALLWIALIAISAIYLERVVPRQRLIAFAGALCVCIFLAALYRQQTKDAMATTVWFSSVHVIGARAVAHIDSASDADLRLLLPWPDAIRSELKDLRSVGEEP